MILKISNLQSDLKKKHGENFVTSAKDIGDVERLPTGVYPFDFACVSGTTILVNPYTGIPREVSNLVGQESKVISLVDEDRLSTGRSARWISKGIKDSLTITCKSGQSIIVAKTHRFKTSKGWVKAKELSGTSKLYSMLSLEGCIPFGDDKLDLDYLRFLGYWLADGSGGGKRAVRLSAKKQFKISAFTTVVTNKGYTLCRGSSNSWSIVGASVIKDFRGRVMQTNIFRQVLEHYKLWDCVCYNKKIPEELFSLRKYQLAILIGALWSCDGTVSKNRASLDYSTVSRVLAHQVRNLLFRFGIYSQLRVKKPKGNRVVCYIISVRGWEDVKLFSDHITLLGNKQKLLDKWVSRGPSRRKSIARENQINSHIFLDKIVSITNIGNIEVFDTQVPITHNYVANGFVNHNSGGGFPRGKMSIVWGKESSGKTNLLFKAIVSNQKLEPDKVNVFLDIEHSFDKLWAKRLGVDIDKLVVIKPDYGEQAVDIIQGILSADDIGVLGIDSIAAMVPVNEGVSTAEKAQVGGNALLVSKMIKKCILELSKASKNGSYPTIIAINQFRTKIGVMFGSPDTQPGGQSLRHVSGLTVKLRGKDIIEKSIDDKRPCFKEMHGVIEKFKVPILCKNFEFNFPVINKGGLSVGQIDSWKTVSAQLKDLGWLYKEGKDVICLDKTFTTFKAVKDYFDKKPKALIGLQNQIIAKFMEDTYGED